MCLRLLFVCVVLFFVFIFLGPHGRIVSILCSCVEADCGSTSCIGFHSHLELLQSGHALEFDVNDCPEKRLLRIRALCLLVLERHACGCTNKSQFELLLC